MYYLITGFAGTLGTAFTEFLLAEGHFVTGIDNSEWAVAAFPSHPHLTKLLGDFSQMTGSFDVIIHCAAYKHIDLIESNPVAAFENNVTKTSRLFREVEGELLFISTDKAVEPNSVYGRQKLQGEVMTAVRGGVVARLGNIFNSSGSVIPVWERALEQGEPLPITDWQMRRYMIPAAVAVQRVLALYPKAKKRQIIVPFMGEAVELRQVVKDFLSGHNQPLDYPVRLIGRRPGEKLEEQLTWPQEEVVYQDTNGIIVTL